LIEPSCTARTLPNAAGRMQASTMRLGTGDARGTDKS
jgi:hypothetical protein